MKERPILFSAPMVRAILDGRKSQTRRIAKDVKHPDLGNIYAPSVLAREPQHTIERASPHGQSGDRLWVRETFAHIYRDNTKPAYRITGDVLYEADGLGLDRHSHGTWKPSIHMPRWASRITLEITAVRIERLEQINEADAAAEGVDSVRNEGVFWQDYQRSNSRADEMLCSSARDSFRTLWDSLAPAGADWDANPWVWVIEFQPIATWSRQ